MKTIKSKKLSIAGTEAMICRSDRGYQIGYAVKGGPIYSGVHRLIEIHRIYKAMK